MIVYLITCKQTGRRYVGLTRRTLSERWKQHVREAPRLKMRIGRAIAAAGADAFTVEVIACARTFLDLIELERLLIAQYGTMDRRRGFNATAGYRGALSEKRSPEHCAKQSAAMRGKVRTPEHQAKLTAAARLRCADPAHRAKMSAAKMGIGHTAESRALMSAQRKGVKRSPEACAAVSAGKMGRKASPEARAAMSAGQRARHAAQREKPSQ